MAGKVGVDASSGGLAGEMTMRSDLGGLIWRLTTDKPNSGSILRRKTCSQLRGEHRLPPHQHHFQLSTAEKEGPGREGMGEVAVTGGARGRREIR